MRAKCTASKQNGKIIQRRKYAQNIEDNRLRIENNKSVYKKRQAIVEHPYGTIKRQWGFSYISTKKYKQRASADVGLMFIAYNIRRVMNIIGQNELKKYLTELVFLFSVQIRQISLHLSPLGATKFLKKTTGYIFHHPLKRLIFEQLLIKSSGF